MYNNYMARLATEKAELTPPCHTSSCEFVCEGEVMYKYHYTYLLKALNPVDKRQFYIGVRSCDVLPTDDDYMSSSKTVHRHIDKGVIFEKSILRIFFSRKDALQHEIALHNNFNVALSDEYFNKAKQTSTGFDTTGVIQPDWQKEKSRKGIIEACANRTPEKLAEVKKNYSKAASTPAARKRRSETGKKSIGPHVWGVRTPERKAKFLKTITATNALPEVKARRSEAAKKLNADPEIKAKISAGLKKAFAKPEVKAKISAAAKKVNSDPAVRLAKSLALKGKKKSTVQRQKVAQARRIMSLCSKMSGIRYRSLTKQTATDWLLANGFSKDDLQNI